MKLTKINLAILATLTSSAIHAESTTTQLDSIVISANNTEQSIRSVTANMTVISAEEIQAKQYQTLDQALKSVPGISTYNNGGLGTSTSIFMRGMDGKNILVLMDGVALNEPLGISGANLNHILMNNVERIEIVKGPQSGVWGADAVAGVINIITKKSSDKTNVNAALELGSNDFKKLTTQVGAGNEQVDFQFGFANTTSDSFSAIKPYGKSEYDYESDPFSQTDTAFKIGVNPTKNQRVQLSLMNSTAQTNYDGTTGPDAINTSDFSSASRQLQYQNQLSSQLQLKAHLQDTQIERSFSSGFEVDSVTTQIGASLKADYLQDHFVEVSATQKTLTDNAKNNDYVNDGLGLSNTFQFNQGNLIFTQALRSDNYSRFEDKVTGKLGLKNWFAEDIFLAGNYGTGYRAPTLSESQYSTLSPETSEAFDFTIGFKNLEVTYFNQQTDNKIEFDAVNSDFNNAIYRYKNVEGISTFEGFDATYLIELASLSTDLSVGYSTLSAKNKDEEAFARRPEQQARVNIDFYGLPKTRIGLETEYVGTNYDKDNQKGAQIGEYFVTHLTANYDVNRHLQLFGKIQNVTDEDYTNAVSKYAADNLTPTYVYANGGRQFFIGVRGSL